MIARVAPTMLTRVVFLTMSIAINVTAQSPSVSTSLAKRAHQLDPFIIRSARRYGLDSHILRTICLIESRYRLDAVSPKGARGPMQFMPETARRYGLKNPHDPKDAFDAAARYLRDLLKRFDGRLDLALAAYNAGEGTVESFRTGRPLVLQTGKIINAKGIVTGGIPPYRETRAYVKAFFELWRGPRGGQWQSATGIHEKTIRFTTSRDFTLDALDETTPLMIRTSPNQKSTFIEIH